ncbi:fibronectin type III domain-containing protein [Elusimicrobiota bacterium]
MKIKGKQKHLKLGIITLLLWLFCLEATIVFAQSVTPSSTTWVTDGTVYVTTTTGDTIYIGGDFTYVGPNTGGGVSLDATTGEPISSFPRLNGGFSAIISDGSGGWYIGGAFDKVGGVARNDIAHILSDGSVDLQWDPNPNGTVWALGINGSNVYAGGTFTSIGGQTRNRIAALDATTGNATSWDPNLNGTVLTLISTGQIVYAGGSLTGGLVALDTTTGNALWNLDANNSVHALAISESQIYAAGYFTLIGGSAVQYFARIDTATANAQQCGSGVIKINGYVRDIVVSGSNIYAGGEFTTISDQARNRIAALATTNCAITSWAPDINDVVWALATNGSNIYVGGDFTSAGGQARNYIAAIDSTTGSAISWNPNAADSLRTLEVIGSNVYAGGQFSSIGGQPRNNIAALDAATGEVTSWDPDANNKVWALALSGSESDVYVGGEFTSIGGQSRNRITALDATTGNATQWHPNANNFVQTLAISGSNVYAGGGFTSIGGQSRNYIAALDGASGNAISWWNPNAGGAVRVIAVNGLDMYMGGDFTSMGGQARNRIAAILLGDGGYSFRSWNPNASNTVLALVIDGPNVYAGGNFTSIGGQADRNYIAAIDSTTGSATSWNPGANAAVYAMTANGSNVYAGGAFTSIGGQARNYIAAIDTATGNAASWDPNANTFVWNLAANGSYMYTGGDFTRIGGDLQSHFAQFTMFPPPISVLEGAAVGVSSITWTWVNITGEDGYRIISSTDGNMSGDLTGNTTFWTETNLSTNTVYTRRVVTFNSVGASTSTAATAYTLAAPPTGFAFMDVFITSASVSWGADANPDDTQYQVIASTSNGFSSSGDQTWGWDAFENSESTSVANLFPNTTYYFKVKARNTDQVETAYSDTSSTVTRIETPASIYIDELSTTSVIISAYAPSFTNLGQTGAGMNLAIDGAYQGWSVAADSWTTRSPMPTVRYLFSGAVVGGKIYTIGGYDDSYLVTNEEYDPVANSWTTKAPMPTARRAFISAVVGGKIYTIGGYDDSYLVTNEEYDPVANSWTTKAPMPTARQGSGAVVGCRIYAIGGLGGESINEQYDPTTNSWTTRAPMPTARWGLTSAVAGGRIYTAGGYNDGNLVTNEEYDPVANSWTTKAPMPTPRRFLTTAVVGGKIYTIGGFNGGNPLATNEEYDPATDSWTTKAPMPTPRRDPATAVVGGKIYTIGGFNGSYLATTEEYDPGLSASFTNLSPNTQHTFKVKARNQHGVETGEISITSYTAVNVPASTATIFSNVYATSATITWTDNNNPGTVEYYLDISTASVFDGTSDASVGWTASMVSVEATGLAPNVTHYFRVKARNSDNVETSYEALGSTLTSTMPPDNLAFSSVFITSITATWDQMGTSPDGFILQASSTNFDGTDTAHSASTSDGSTTSLTVMSLTPDTTYYLRAGALWGDTTDYTASISTITQVLAPQGLSIGQVRVTSVTASWSTLDPNPGHFTLEVSSTDYDGTDIPVSSETANVSITSLSVFSPALNPNTTYYLRVGAFWNNTTNYASSVSTVTLATPVDLSFNFSGVHYTSATLAWNTLGSGAEGYILQACATSDFSENIFSSATYNINLSTLALTGLSQGTEYYFRVGSLNTNEVANYVTAGSTVTSAMGYVLDPSLSAVYMTSMTITWDSVGGASYNAVLATDSGYSTIISSGLLPTNTTTYIGLSGGSTYYFEVKLSTEADSSYSPNRISAVTYLETPSAPSATVLGVSSITWNWTDITGESFWKVVSSTGGNVSGNLNAGTTSWPETSLSTNTAYARAVSAYSQQGYSTSSFTTAYTLAAPPTGFAFVDVFITSMSVNWGANTNPSGTDYQVDRWVAGGSTTSVTVAGTTATLTGLTGGTTYFLQVRAINGDEVLTSADTQISTVTFNALGFDLNPAFSAVYVASVTVSWDSVNGASYNAVLATDSGYSTIISSGLLSTNTTTYTGLSGGSAYYFEVKLSTEADSSYSPNRISTVTYLATPAAPSATVPGVSSITWSWTDITGESLWKVVSSSGGNVSGNLAADVTSWPETGLSTNTAYARAVSAYSQQGYSTSSFTTAYTLAAPPAGFAFVDVFVTSMSVNWGTNTNPGGTDYQVDRWVAGGSTTSVTVAGTTATLTGLTGGTTYFLQVRAINGDEILTAADTQISTVTLGMASAEETVSPGESKSITYTAPSGEVQVDIPQNTFTENVQVTVQTPSSFPSAVSPTAELQATGVGVEITLDKAVQPKQYVNITVSYQDSDVVGLNENNLILSRYDTGKGVWVPLVSTPDPLNNKVTGRTNHFSTFQIMQSNPSSSVSSIKAFPNPLRPARGHKEVTFSNLPANAKIRIYTFIGELVKEMTSNATGMASWDGTNQAGANVASGVYFVFAEGEGGEKTIKVGIQR